jgi:hypothetical protein
MNTLQPEISHSTHMLIAFITVTEEGFGYAFATPALYATSMGVAYFIFQAFFNF